MDQFLADIDLIWSNCLLFNSEGSEITKFALSLRSITLNLVKKLKVFELQTAQQQDVEMEEDSDFGMLINPDLYVKFDDKIKFAEMLKQCSRDQLTKVV